MTGHVYPDAQTEFSDIRANAALVVEQCGKICGFKFGFDEESVQWLDGFIERLRNAPTTDTQNERYVSTFGSFLGEAIIASYGGAWAVGESGPHVRFDDKNLVLPFSKVAKQIENGGEDSIFSFFQMIPLVFPNLNEIPPTAGVVGARSNSSQGARSMLTDSHFLVPLIVFCIGLALLIVLH